MKVSCKIFTAVQLSIPLFVDVMLNHLVFGS